MESLVLIIIGLVLVLVGVTLIFDSRLITKKFFSFGDQNDGSLGLKITGFIISMIGAFVIFFL